MIAQFSGAKITAVNINPMHLDLLRRHNEDAKISNRIIPFLADYHETGLPDASFDGVYMCESAGKREREREFAFEGIVVKTSPPIIACTYDHKVLCKEVFRVLKPGARFVAYDWGMTDKVS